MRLRYAVCLGFAASLLTLAGCNVTVTVADGTWTAECTSVLPADCEGVAELFVNNLARAEHGVREDSGGIVRISPAACPEELHPDAVAYLDLSACWRAIAPTIQIPRACMIVARQKDPANALLPFGQAGGDNFTGLAGAPDPGTTPC